MADFTISVDEEVLEVLMTVAKYRKVKVEDLLREIVLEDIEGIKRRMNDPIIGIIDSGQTDISERDEEILRSEWRPD